MNVNVKSLLAMEIWHGQEGLYYKHSRRCIIVQTATGLHFIAGTMQ